MQITTTAKEVEERVEGLLALVMENTSLISSLEGCREPGERWHTLEGYVTSHLKDFKLREENLEFPIYMFYMRDWFFYEMQQRTKMDFGFCKHFIPAYREYAKYSLEGMKTNPDENWNKCNYESEEVETTCIGTARDICVFLKS